MSKSFRLDDSGHGDAVLTIVLTVSFLALSCFNIWIRVADMAIYPAPLIAFGLTRWAYKRHFSKRLASRDAQSSACA